MTSKVLVKLPVAPFSQRKKSPTEIIALPSRNDDGEEGRFQGQNSDKVTQLEQNMKFLQEQHKATLVALHQEVEILRQRNRDLQFQIVFSTLYDASGSSPSSPEDSKNNGITKSKQSQHEKQGSPACVNIAPLQVELLEKELQDVKATLAETNKRNLILADLVDQQKKTAEVKQEKPKTLDVGLQIFDKLLECQQVELQTRLDEAELLVKRLRQESEEQRREIASLKAAAAAAAAAAASSPSSPTAVVPTNSVDAGMGSQHGSSSGTRHRGSAQGVYQSRNSAPSEDDNYQKFPPLQTQSYWHRTTRGKQSSSSSSNSSYVHSPLQQHQQQQSSEYQRNSRHQHQHQQQQQHQQRHQQTEQRQENVEPEVDGMLPQLRNGSVRVDNTSSCPPFYRSRSHHNSNNYYKDERNGRKYKGQKAHRERREQTSREYHHQQHQHHNQEYKDNGAPQEMQQQQQQQQQMRQYQREYADLPKLFVRGPRNARRQQ